MISSSNILKEKNKVQGRFRLFLYITVLFSALDAHAHAQGLTTGPGNTVSPGGSATPAAPTSGVPVPADTVQTATAMPPATKTCPVTTTPPSSPAEAGHILVIGDSQAQGLARGLRWLYRTNRNMLIRDHSKPSTGLIAADFYNWPEEVHKLAATEHDDVAVMLLGANDRPQVRVHGVVDPGLLANFTKMYSARVRDIIVTLQNAHIPVIWVGHPMNRNDKYSEDMKILNTIFENQAMQNGAQFVPLWTAFSEDGHFAPYGKGVDGSTVRLRIDDGVHLTPEGYQKAAKILEPVIACYQPGRAQQAKDATTPATPASAPSPTAASQHTSSGPA